MRLSLIPILFLLLPPACRSAERYDIKPDLKTYPQSEPKETLASVIKAVEAKKHDYVLAQLSDPKWVDEQVKKSGDKLAPVVEEARNQLGAFAMKHLKELSKSGAWMVMGDKALVSHDKVPGRVVRLVRIGDRWYLRNDYTPE